MGVPKYVLLHIHKIYPNSMQSNLKVLWILRNRNQNGYLMQFQDAQFRMINRRICVRWFVFLVSCFLCYWSGEATSFPDSENTISFSLSIKKHNNSSLYPMEIEWTYGKPCDLCFVHTSWQTNTRSHTQAQGSKYSRHTLIHYQVFCVQRPVSMCVSIEKAQPPNETV